MSGEGAALASRLRTEIIDLAGVVERAEYLLAKAQERHDNDYLDGVALNLQGFYAGVERLFEEMPGRWTAQSLLALSGIEIS